MVFLLPPYHSGMPAYKGMLFSIILFSMKWFAVSNIFADLQKLNNYGYYILYASQLLELNENIFYAKIFHRETQLALLSEKHLLFKYYSIIKYLKIYI